MTTSHPASEASVDVRWIVAHGGDPGVRLLEVDVSPAAYDQGHIPGAILWDAYVDLRDADYRPVSAKQVQQLFSRSGITPESTVVVYGYAAPLGLWFLKAHGHRDARILEGPRDVWAESGERWTQEVPRVAESAYPIPSLDAGIFASREDVEAAIGEAGSLIVDVRSEEEYTGERFWPTGAPADGGRAGHVPGAVPVPISSLRAENGSARSVEEIRRAFEDAGVTRDKAVITYCTIGNRASEAWFALKYRLDYPRVRVYYDSWAVWGRLPDTPIDE